MNGVKEIANSGKYAVINPPVQGFVVLTASDTLTPLTAALDVYFQKLWIYPGVTAAKNKVATNAATVYVGKKGTRVLLPAVTLACARQVVTVTAASHGLTPGAVAPIVIAGATPAEYNGAWTATVVDANTLSYTLAHEPGDMAITGTITCEYQLALNVTPDALAPADLPMKYELPLGQKMRLNDIVIQGAQGDGVFYSVW